MDRSARMLLEQIVNMLDHSGIALANRSHRFAKPADSRPEGNAILLYLSLIVKIFQSPPKIVLVDLLHPDVV